jgi:1-acyl-sn-glycerol-3-phosphate acyltransferase
MLYYFLKYYVRFTLLLFCKRITIHDKKAFQREGPFLIGANHPNSFFDAILVGTFMKVPVHFMTRSDVFRFKAIRFILGKLQMIPVYRIRDGKDKLSLNEQSFREAKKSLRRGHHVLIFVEGFCNYQTTLQPLKKGGARILEQSWKEHLPVEMLPLWIRYNSFHSFAKEIDLIPGIPFDVESMPAESDTASRIQEINKKTSNQLAQLSHTPSPKNKFTGSFWLAPFAAIGFMLHAPFYFLFAPAIRKTFRKNVHYDSVLFALLSLFYPLWLLFAFWIGMLIGHFYIGLAVFLFLPVTARAYVLWK